MEFSSTKITAITLVDQVEEQILKNIIGSKLTPGSDIPSELALAEELNVGRSVVREALSRLRMLGIIESRKHKGMILREPDVMKCFSKVINPYLLGRTTILDLLDLRVSIESGIAELVIANITDDDIKELEKIVAKHEYQDNIKLRVESEIEFHSSLYRITGNKAIIQMQEMILPLFTFVNTNFDDFKSLNKSKEKPVRHEDLLPPLKNRDVVEYRAAIYNHLKAYSEYVKLHRG